MRPLPQQSVLAASDQPVPSSSLIFMLAVIGLELFNSHLIGNALPSSTRRYNRMKALQPGDLVIETSTSGWWRRADRPAADKYDYLVVENVVGFLERVTEEPYPVADGDEPWDEAAEGKPEPKETVYYIRRLASGGGAGAGEGERTFRWTNASFVTILPVEGWKGLMEI